MFVGFAAGIILQIELLNPRIWFLSDAVWPSLLTLHAWSTPLALLVICLSTISYIRPKNIWGLWRIWLGFCIVPLLFAALLQLITTNASTDNFLSDTMYVTGFRHALGTAVLLAALGGLSAMNKVKLKVFSRKISFIFALFIASSGTVLAVFQTVLGLNGMPRRYIGYPNEFAQLQLYSGIAAITCFSLSAAYVIFLWRRPYKIGIAEEVF